MKIGSAGCLAFFSCCVSIAQTVSQEPGQIVAHAGSCKLEWRRHYQFETGLVPVGISDAAGTLWLITHAGHGNPKDFLTKIGPHGDVIQNYDPIVPLSPIESVAYLAPAVSGKDVGLLASLVSGGRDQTFEGAFFLPVEASGLGEPIRISKPGPQFPTLVGGAEGQFVAAGDQQPLTLIKLDSTGHVLWRRAFSRRLVLPTVSVSSSGTIFVLSQGGTYVLLQMLDSSGRVLRSKTILAKQGTVAADPDGGCSLLVSVRSGGEGNKVYLLTLDAELRQLSRIETPLIGHLGRTYDLISTVHGHLAIGEGPERNPQKVIPKKIIVEFDRSGGLIWQQQISSLFTPLLCPFRSGFYVVRDVLEGTGLDIERYVY